jgi:hypothetical protein
MGEDLLVDGEIATTIALLHHYGFDVTTETVPELLDHWQSQYPGDWIRLAVIEALYRGRYKQISVEEILRRWQKLGQPQVNFNSDFEVLISAKIDTPQTLVTLAAPPLLGKQEQISAFPTQVMGFDTYQKLKAIAQEQTEADDLDKKNPSQVAREEDIITPQ